MIKKVFANKKWLFGKKAISEEVVRTILVVVVSVIFLFAAKSLIAGFFIKHDPNDVETEASFQNLGDELQKIINEPGAYSVKETVPFSISNKYSIIGLNMNTKLASARILPFSYQPEDEFLIRYSISRALFYLDNISIDQCKSTCICLLKRNDPKLDDKSYLNRINYMSYYSDKYSQFKKTFSVEKCIPLGDNVVLYSFTSFIKYTYYSSGYNTMTYFFPGNNYGGQKELKWLENFDSLSKSATPLEGQEVYGNFKVQGSITADLHLYGSAFYSDLYLGDFTATSGWIDLQLFYHCHDKFECLKEMNDGKYYILPSTKTTTLYVDKLDFSKMKFTNPSYKDKVFIFIGPSDPYITSKNFDRYGQIAVVDPDTRINGEITFKGNYSLLDIRKAALNQLRFRDKDTYVRNIMTGDDKISILYGLDYFSYITNNKLFNDAEMKQKMNELGFQNIIRVRDALKNRLDNCEKSDIKDKEKCKLSFFDNCDWTSEQMCQDILSKSTWSKNPADSVDYINQILRELAKDKPAILFDFVLEDTNKLISDGKYFEALKIYSDFIDAHKSVFYDTDGKLNDFESSIPRSKFLRNYLILKKMMADNEFSFYKSNSSIIVDTIVYVMNNSIVNYTFVPGDGVLYDGDLDEQMEFELGFYLEQLSYYDGSDLLIILTILNEFKEKNCINISDKFEVTSDFEACEAKYV